MQTAIFDIWYWNQKDKMWIYSISGRRSVFDPPSRVPSNNENTCIVTHNHEYYAETILTLIESQ